MADVIHRAPDAVVSAVLRLGASAVLLGSALLLAGCGEAPEAKVPEPRPVRTVLATSRAASDAVTLTGQVEAQNEATYGFRIGGRIIERLVNVGDQVKPGQVLARLDPQDEQNALRSAQAALSAANANLSQTRNQYERQRQLLARGFTPRAQYEQAEQAFLNARSQVEDTEARLRMAEDRLGFTDLKADSAGVVTQRRAEPGEVVQAGQPVVEVARRDGRDAVFEVPAALLTSLPGDPEVEVTLSGDPAVRAIGRVREVAPQADPVTRTFRVRVGLIDPPEGLRLGTTVIGRVVVDSGPVIEIPASALTRFNDKPAVWVVDPKAQTVSLRNVEVLRFSPATVSVAEGLKPSEIVVTAGVQALHPGQKVRLLGTQL
ncbi:efflux RND transporter periplasmic adaptor subunit [Xanthobacter oligotrophicus]|uniref:efflux RND transporter periplasmic adaptor subunit n=1 Tax=Xanthobacter oligotrophicus TaxID=2607286 RepID=UPI0011F29946|nr:efflux RND transporter periplasmic adaptor subunit [Xanthobacter oligotrophicus]MCG5235692.1 efflux RND transporter periplasmic adaptor subunit [Xanthobacter oligotrophicus]